MNLKCWNNYYIICGNKILCYHGNNHFIKKSMWETKIIIMIIVQLIEFLMSLTDNEVRTIEFKTYDQI